MKLNFHPAAIADFNAKGEALLSELTPEPRGLTRQSTGGFLPDLPIAGTFSAEQMSNLRLKLKDASGINVTARYFHKDGENVGLYGDGYKKLARLAEQIQGGKEARTHVSVEAIEIAIFDWITSRVLEASPVLLAERILSEIEPQIVQREMWIPLFGTYLESNLTIGRISFRTVDPDLFEPWCQRFDGSDDPRHQAALLKLREHQREFRALAAGVITVEAEPIRATEVAFDETERALVLQRHMSRHSSRG